MSDLVTVFESVDVALLAIAKASLDDAGIRYVTQGEHIQDLIGMGRAPGGYNLLTGPTRIRVLAEDAEAARELLRDMP